MTHSDFNHLLSSIKTLSPEQMRRLRQRLESELARSEGSRARPSAGTSKAARAAAPEKRPLTRDEFNRRLMTQGLVTRLPDPSLDIDDDGPDDAPVPIKGEPLSETIIRDRR